MSAHSEDQLARFREQSDNAFFQMQRQAEERMAAFLSRYGTAMDGSVATQQNLFSKPTTFNTDYSSSPPSGQQATPAQQAPPAAQPSSTVAGDFAGAAPVAAAGAAAAGAAQSLSQSQDFKGFSGSLKRESRQLAQDAVKGTSEILKQSASNLGEKAKREAAALQAAVKNAMAEERTLKAKRARAAQEVREAKARMEQEMRQAKKEAMGGLGEMARDKAVAARQRATEMAKEGQGALEAEWDNFLSKQGD